MRREDLLRRWHKHIARCLPAVRTIRRLTYPSITKKIFTWLDNVATWKGWKRFQSSIKITFGFIGFFLFSTSWKIWLFSILVMCFVAACRRRKGRIVKRKNEKVAGKFIMFFFAYHYWTPFITPSYLLCRRLHEQRISEDFFLHSTT